MEYNAEQLAQQQDRDLARLYQQGHVPAFAELVHRYRLELFHFLARFLGDKTAAEDVFQEAFLQVHLAIDSYDAERPFKPWLFTIAANKARDYLRRNNRGVAHLTVLTDEDGDAGRQVIDLLDAGLPLPADLAENQETQAHVRLVVDSLPVHLKEILILAYFHQIAYKDIAQALGIPLGTVKSRLHAAVGTFAQAWKKRFGEPPTPPAS